jgi:hypothetical protein
MLSLMFYVRVEVFRYTARDYQTDQEGLQVE